MYSNMYIHIIAICIAICIIAICIIAICIAKYSNKTNAKCNNIPVLTKSFSSIWSYWTFLCPQNSPFSWPLWKHTVLIFLLLRSLAGSFSPAHLSGLDSGLSILFLYGPFPLSNPINSFNFNYCPNPDDFHMFFQLKYTFWVLGTYLQFSGRQIWKFHRQSFFFFF